MRKKVFVAAALMLFWVLPTPGFAQSSNATLTGTVSDASGAVIPGVTVTSTNVATGIISSIVTNDAGVYNFPSLLPGQYKVSAAQPGFQTQTYTDVQLGNAAQVRLNFALQVNTLAQSVEVTIAGDRLLLESSSSVGQVLEQKHVVDMPLTSNNVLDLANVMAGVTVTRSPIFAAGDTQFAGVSAANVNVQRDGVSVNGQRWPTGINSATELNPDLVGEVKMILAPVDAEMGRGSGQVQVQTRSGTNQFHGAAVWNVKNSALDANIWDNNRTLSPLTGEPKAAPWRNVHQATLSLGGPIKKNKTYFFVLYDQKWARMRQVTEPLVLTPCARNGIFRYYDGWNNGNVLQVTQATGATPVTAVVNRDGSPKAPATLPNGQAHNGILRYASVFGPLQNVPTKPDCSDAIVTGSSWDPYRTGYDPTGYVKSVLFKNMPAANAYDLGDGLNTAGSNWLQPLNGSDNLFGIGEPTERKQINVKIDHYFSEKHKISGTYSFERNWADDSMGWWPDPFMGITRKQPQVLAINFTSTLRPTLLNEARFGVVRNGQNVFSPLYNLPTNQPLLDLLPKAGQTTYAPQLGSTASTSTAAALSYQSPIGARTFTPQVLQRDQTPRYQYGDSVTWMKGKHSFKFGAEFRVASSKATQSGPFPAGCGGDSTFPIACGGQIEAFSPPVGINSTNMPGLGGSATTGNQDRAENLLNYLSGSLASIAQYRFINLPGQANQAWNDPSKDPYRIRDMHQKEFGSFFKDDFKVSRNFTLNLGVRWDYYGAPWEKSGMMATLKDAGAGLFSISGRGFDGWMKPGTRAGLSELIFVGPNSPNESVNSYKRDWNNFGPAVGFAWNMDKQTVVRGGYQIQYIGGGGLTTIDTNFGNPPGSSTTAFYTGDTGTPYLDLTKVQSNLLPIKPVALPVQPIPITDRTQAITAYDPGIVSPYIQNMTLSVTRSVGSKLTLDFRYIGTLSRKQLATWDINVPNYLSNGLIEAFNAARAGGESALLDQMFNGINIAGAGHGPVGTVVNGVVQTGALHLRDTTALRTNLAMGNYVALANSVASLNYSTSPAFPGNQNLPFQPGNVNGTVLRLNGFPENFIKTNPQFSAANLVSNAGHSNYHSMQAQVTLRPTYGLSLQASYTWSKNLTLGPGGFTDPRNQAADYTLSTQNRAHVLNSYGTYNLPFGPGQLLMKDSSGWTSHVAEGWQVSWIVNLSTGAPETMTGANMLYARGTPDQVRPFDFKGQRGVVWQEGALAGSYFNYQLQNVKDPQCLAIATSLQSACTLQAVADLQGNIILQNAQPGKRGNIGLMSVETAGTWNTDMALSKSFRITERLRGTFRMDARNIFNHPTPGTVATGFAATTAQFVGNINDTVNRFGAMTTKGSAVPQSDYQDSRQFEFRLRIDF